MRDTCFVIAGFFVVLVGFLAFVKPGGYEHAWFISLLLAAIAVLIGLFIPTHSTQRSIQVETEAFTVSVSLPNAPPSQPGALIPHNADMLSETRVHRDLQTLVSQPGRIGQHFELQRQRRQREKEIQLVNQYGEFFSSATQMIEAKNKMLRARNEYLGMERENEEKNAEKEANIAKHQADAAEHRKRLQDLTNPPAPPPIEPKLTAAQQRILKKAELEQELHRLKADETDAFSKAGSEAERRRVQNMYASRRDQLTQQLEKYL